MEQQQNTNNNKALFFIAFAKIAYTVVLGLITSWLLNTKGFDHGFWWGALSVIMIVCTVNKAIETILFTTIALTCKDD